MLMNLLVRQLVNQMAASLGKNFISMLIANVSNVKVSMFMNVITMTSDLHHSG